jgi:hypothetical protein
LVERETRIEGKSSCLVEEWDLQAFLDARRGWAEHAKSQANPSKVSLKSHLNDISRSEKPSRNLIDKDARYPTNISMTDHRPHIGKEASIFKERFRTLAEHASYVNSIIMVPSEA